MSALRVAIAGATGWTGRAVVRVAAADPACEIVAAVTAAGDPLCTQDAGRVAGVEPIGVPVSTDIAVPCDALIEFTLPDACATWAQWCVRQGVPLVSGTTGLDESQQAVLRAAAKRIPLVWAPNMSVGISLMQKIAAELAAALPSDWDIEICETHHRRKIDAPSGTARALLEAVCAARGQPADGAAVYGRSGHCGPRPPGQIGVHAVRMGAITGEHEIHFTSAAESFTLRHRAFSRDTFAAGALRAARWLQGRPPGWYSMRDVLGIQCSASSKPQRI